MRLINSEGVPSELLLSVINITTVENRVIEIELNSSIFNKAILYDLMEELDALFQCRPFQFNNSILFNKEIYFYNNQFCLI